MAFKTIPVEQAVGMVLPHDVTEIRQADMLKSDSGFKGPAFRKGHIIRQQDIVHLKRLGKDHIYVLKLNADDIHENEAAKSMADALAGSGVVFSGKPTEGKISLLAEHDGLLKIDSEALFRFNMLGEVMCSTLHTNTPVKKGEQVAATRLIPLVGKRNIVEQAVEIGRKQNGIVNIRKLRRAKVGLVITGNEVYHGRIKDRFEAVLRKKLTKLDSKVIKVCFAPDDINHIGREIKNCLDEGADLIVTSGGMSVDPDDVTRLGIARAGATDIVYGTPVLPGAMFLYGKIGSVPVIGLPACGMYHSITIFDLLLPRILTGETIDRTDLAKLGHGGLCRNCKTCQYPVCPFGK